MKLSVHKLSLAGIAMLGLFAATSRGQLLLSDDFTVSTYEGQQSPNTDILDGTRQSGTLAPSPYTITTGNNVQTGNTGTSLINHTTSDGNYLLISSSTVRNDLVINADLADDKPLVFSFTLYLSNTTDNWGAFTLEDTIGNGSGAVAGPNQFSFYVRGNGEVNVTNNSATYYTSAVGAVSSGGTWSVVLSDAAGTGSPFGGNGTYVSLYYNDTLVDGRLLASEFGDIDLKFGFRGFSGIYMGVDNLTLTAVPEPAVVGYLVTAGLGCLALTRRLRRHI